jgi:diguanylate cyclase (GGDEF)-like protein
LRAFIESSPAVAFIKDPKGRLLYVNKPMTSEHRPRLDEVRWAAAFSEMTAEVLEAAGPNDRAVIESGQSAQFLEVVPTPDGPPHYWLVIRFPFQDRRGRRRLGGLAFDVTEQRAIEARLTEQLRIAEGLNAELKRQRTELARANDRLLELSTSDGLTGLRNYGHFRETLDSAFSRASRERKPLSLAMIDVDDFKAFNDDFGHDAGNAALCSIAAVLRRCVRNHDLVARYGGEEFAVILPSTGKCGSLFACERMRASVELNRWTLRTVTVSIGVATMYDPMSHPNDLLAMADQALYHSKRQGRNLVTHHSELRSSELEHLPARPTRPWPFATESNGETG